MSNASCFSVFPFTFQFPVCYLFVVCPFIPPVFFLNYYFYFSRRFSSFAQNGMLPYYIYMLRSLNLLYMSRGLHILQYYFTAALLL